MSGEELETIIEQVSVVHHALTGMLTNLQLALEMGDMLSPAEQRQLEGYWQQAHLEAIQRLRTSLACFPKPPSLRPRHASRPRQQRR
jgi:hypothetical protein